MSVGYGDDQGIDCWLVKKVFCGAMTYVSHYFERWLIKSKGMFVPINMLQETKGKHFNNRNLDINIFGETIKLISKNKSPTSNNMVERK